LLACGIGGVIFVRADRVASGDDEFDIAKAKLLG
jgi:hypothetical protein